MATMLATDSAIRGIAVGGAMNVPVPFRFTG